MSFQPNAKQTLFLWRMIAGETLDEREPMKSKARPDLDTKRERQPLIDQGFLSVEKRSGKRGEFLRPTEKAWEWASHACDAQIMNSQFAAGALQGLLRRLLPFIQEREIALAELFRESSVEQEALTAKPSPASPGHLFSTSSGNTSPEALWPDIRQACLTLGEGTSKSRVRLQALRQELSSISRGELDRTLIALQRQQRLVLYRDDNTPALTEDDHAAALLVGDSPRHLVYLEE